MIYLSALAACAVLALTGCQSNEQDKTPESSENKATRVVTETAGTGPVSEKVSTTGTIKPQREVVVAAEAAGRVVSLPVSLGAEVEAGALLARLDGTVQEAQLEQARATLRQSRAALELAEGEFKRGTVLHQKQAFSDSLLEQARIQRDSSEASVAAAQAGLKLAEKAAADCSLRAPFSGSVAEVRLELGALMAPGTPAFLLVSVDQLRVVASVSSSVVGRIEPGMPVQLQVPSLGSRIFSGVVEHLGPSADPRTRTYPLEVLVDNADGALRPGMMAKVEVILAHRSDAVLVPISCIIEDPGANAFVVIDGHAIKRSLELGQSRGELVEVLSGIAAGEQVVSLGRQNLRDGDPVTPYDMASSGNEESNKTPPATASRGDGGNSESD